jgi:hypothetical protein
MDSWIRINSKLPKAYLWFLDKQYVKGRICIYECLSAPNHVFTETAMHMFITYGLLTDSCFLVLLWWEIWEVKRSS